MWVATLLSDESNHVTSVRWLQDWMGARNGLIVPCLFPVEVGSAIARRRRSAAEGDLAVRGVRSNPLVDVRDLSRSSWESAAQLAAQLELRAGDAVYVALAADLDLPLLTWDREILTRAAEIVDVRTPDQLPI